MKKVLLALLLAPALAYAEKRPPNAADYPIVIHVQSSHQVGGSAELLHMNVLIDGKKYELVDPTTNHSVLRLGDYKARVDKDDTSKPFLLNRTYELLLPDGTTRKFVVVGESE